MELFRCDACQREGTRDTWPVNPRQGYLQCGCGRIPRLLEAKLPQPNPAAGEPMACQISNAYGIVAIEGAEAVGYRGQQEVCRLPLPLNRADAESIIHRCLDRDKPRRIGVTGEMFIRHNLTKGGA